MLHSEGKNGQNHIFQHPFLQTWLLAVGEFVCLFISLASDLWREGRSNDKNENHKDAKDTKSEAKDGTKFNPLIFLPAAILQQGSRCLVFMALIFTTASSYQILSGSLVIFTCIFSKIFLKKVLAWHKWIGVTVILGKKTIIISFND